jgi:hypothetical protein
MCFYTHFIEGTYQLAREERLYDYKFFSIEELSDIKMYPPINDDLIQLLQNKTKRLYLGKRWLEQ